MTPYDENIQSSTSIYNNPLNLSEDIQIFPTWLPLTNHDIMMPPLNSFNPSTLPQWWDRPHIIEVCYYKGLVSYLYLYYKPCKLHQQLKMHVRFYGNNLIKIVTEKTVDNGTYITDINICRKYKTTLSRCIYKPEVHQPYLYGQDMTSYRLVW